MRAIRRAHAKRCARHICVEKIYCPRQERVAESFESDVESLSIEAVLDEINAVLVRILDKGDDTDHYDIFAIETSRALITAAGTMLACVHDESFNINMLFQHMVCTLSNRLQDCREAIQKQIKPRGKR